MNILDYRGLLHRLVSCHLLGPRYQIYSGHYLYPPIIFPHSHVLWSDGGPQYTSKQFNDFVQRWDFTHITSSLRNPQSNGKAESAVKSTKKLIQTCWTGRSLDHKKFCIALLQYHSTPSRKDRLSPAQKLFGHPVQDILPAHHRASSQNGSVLLLQLSSSDIKFGIICSFL